MSDQDTAQHDRKRPRVEAHFTELDSDDSDWYRETETEEAPVCEMPGDSFDEEQAQTHDDGPYTPTGTSARSTDATSASATAAVQSPTLASPTIRALTLKGDIFGPPAVSDLVQKTADLLFQFYQSPGVEFETKLGCLTSNVAHTRIEPPVESITILSSNPEFHFDASVNTTVFQNLNVMLNQLSAGHMRGRMAYQHVKELDVFFDNGVRETRLLDKSFLVDNAPLGLEPSLMSIPPSVVILKRKLQHINFFSPLDPLDFRLRYTFLEGLRIITTHNSASIEEPFSQSLAGLRPTTMRYKDRLRYRIEIWSVDLSRVKRVDLQTGSVVQGYEVEVELMDTEVLRTECQLSVQHQPNSLFRIAETFLQLTRGLIQKSGHK